VKWPRVSRKEGRNYKGVAIQRGLEHGCREIAIVRNRYQETSSDGTAGWKSPSVCCSDL
jgi:hypothetical protein